MSLFDHLPRAEQDVLDAYFDTADFAEGAQIIAQGAPGDGCYLIDAGTVRI